MKIFIKTTLLLGLFFFINPKLASAQVCTYHAKAEVREDSSAGPLVEINLSQAGKYGVSNDKQYAKDNQIPAGLFGIQLWNKIRKNIDSPDGSKSVHIYHDENYSGASRTAWVKLMGLDLSKYQIIGKYCSGDGCPNNVRQQTADDTITGFQAGCETNLTYGWIVKERTNKCGNSCTYSEIKNGRTVCFVGHCLDGSYNCSLNNNCGFVNGCSNAQQVSCPGHEISPTATPTPTERPTKTPTPSPTRTIPRPSPVPDCYIYHQGSQARTGIVVIAENGFDKQEFLNHVSRQVADLKRTNLKDEGILDYINIYALNPYKHNGPRCNLIRCFDSILIDPPEATKAKQLCSSSAYVLFSRQQDRSYTQMLVNTHAVIFRNDLYDIPNIFPHELGHLVARLDDEYVEHPIPRTPVFFKNCALRGSINEKEICPVWRERYPKSSYPEMGCINGCSAWGFYRSTENSIMNNSFIDNQFNAISLDAWRNVLGIGQARSQSIQESNESSRGLFVTFNITGDSPKIENALGQEKYVPDLDNDESLTKINKGYFIISLKDEQGQILYQQPVWRKGIIITEKEGQESVVIKKVTASLPFFENLKVLTLSTPDGKILNSYNISDFDLMRKIEPGSTTAYSKKPICQDGDVNHDGIVNTLDAVIVLKRAEENKNSYESDLNCDNKLNALDSSIINNLLGNEIQL